MLKLTTITHALILEKVKTAEVIIDATLGNGHDLIFVVQNCQAKAKVYGLDIQAAAINSTQEKLAQLNSSIEPVLIKECHSQIKQYVSNLDLAIFNFGYLPAGDKKITTKAQTSLLALEQSLEILNPKGIISLMLYPGHAEGAIEAKAIEEFLAKQRQTRPQLKQFITKLAVNESKPNHQGPIHYLLSLN